MLGGLGITPYKNRKLHTAAITPVTSTAHTIMTYPVALLFRRHDRHDCRPAFVQSNTARTIVAPKKKLATSRPPLVVVEPGIQGLSEGSSRA